MKGLKKYRFIFLTIGALALFYYFSLPSPLFHDGYSTVMEDRQGNLLGASMAPDGQWRFPEGPAVPDKFKTAIIIFEDKRFNRHPGVDIMALARALRQNWQAGKVVSGGSTLSMQVIRLARKNKSRTVWEKVIEIMLATRLELRYSKAEILALYAAHAPFGGNVVGLEAACWRYFGRDAADLSWAEAALLAVLPNNPALIHPGKNRMVLKQKRDLLLQRLLSNQVIDSTTFELSIAESIPENPLPLPRLATHLLTRSIKEGHSQQRIRTTLDLHLQERVSQIITDHHIRLRANQVHNAAALVVEVSTGNVVSYVGNAPAGPDHGGQVDIVTAKRSTGSILKPFLYAALLDEGKILPRTLQPDIPTLINGFSPRNFTKDYDGAVPADLALIRSLNIPAVYELQDYRYEKFYELLRQIGITTLHQPPDHYGLSLILGGAEATLWDLTGAYASLARTLIRYFDTPGKARYRKSDFHPPYYQMSGSVKPSEQEASSWISAGAAYLTFDVLRELYRPGEETGWRLFNSSKTIAWKTGTSHGLRDGWAIGINGDYAVGVWVGNADGEGRPGLTGTESASPIMFDIFSQLPGNRWFSKPAQELVEIKVCQRSGMRATEVCDQVVVQEVLLPGLQSNPCRYHQRIHVSEDRRYRVHTDCESLSHIVNTVWFVLPPVQEYYYKSKNLSYQSLPPFRRDCVNPATVASMELIYPRANARIFIPHELDGTKGSALFEVAHRQPGTSVFWHLDGVYVGITKGSHRLAMAPDAGPHILTLVDESGTVVEQRFSVIDRN